MSELIINLWAIYDVDSGFVYGLSGKAYNVSGDDKFKLSVLKSLARTDHITVKRYQVPSRFQITYTDETVKNSLTQLNAINDPNANLFNDIFSNLESELPPEMRIHNGDIVDEPQKIPEDPLCVITILYEDEQGNVTPIATDSDREWVKEQENLRGR
jgi:hypothetical protein